MPASPREVIIYVRLLDEGTEVFRPTTARIIEPDFYEILPTPDYNPETETWEFPPGSVVSVAQTARDSGGYLLATSLAKTSADRAWQELRELRSRVGKLSIEEILSTRDEGRK